MGFIAKTIGIIAFILLYIKGEPAPSILGWLGLVILVDFICTSALKKDVKKYGWNHNTLITKSWVVIGSAAEILIIVISIYTFLYD
jgi:hypothetical protein